MPPLFARSTVVCALAVATLSVAGCGDGEAPLPGAVMGSSPAEGARGAWEPQGPDASDPSVSVRVLGTVVDARGAVVAGRSVAVVDARAERIDVVTDGRGRFAVEGVSPPYDVAVDADRGEAPSVYLGLRRADPWLSLATPREARGRSRSQMLRMSVIVPPCAPAQGACWVTLATRSRAGAGIVSRSYLPAITSIDLEVQHAWDERVAAGETLTAHVLTGTGARTSFAYARLDGLPARPGEPTDVGVVTPASLAATAAVSMSARWAPRVHASAAAARERWTWTLASWIELDGVALPLRYDHRADAVLRFPRLPGATARVTAWAQGADARGGVGVRHVSSRATRAGVPLSIAHVDVDLPAPIGLAAPALGDVVRSPVSLVWADTDRALRVSVIAHEELGRSIARVHEGEGGFSFARLHALGLVVAEEGLVAIDTTAIPGASVDDLVDPDAGVRARLDPPSASTFVRVALRAGS